MNTKDTSRRSFLRALAAGSAALSFSYWDFAPAFAGLAPQQPPTKNLDDKWGTVRQSEGFLRQAYPSLLRRNQKS